MPLGVTKDGALGRVLRGLGQQSRLINTPNANNTLGQPTPPRPPSPDPAQSTLGQGGAPPIPTGAEGMMGGGGPMMSPPPPGLGGGDMLGAPMSQTMPIDPMVNAESAGVHPAGVEEGPALRFWRENGMFPTYLSLQIMTTRDNLKRTLGREPNRNEVLQSLAARDFGEYPSDIATI